MALPTGIRGSARAARVAGATAALLVCATCNYGDVRVVEPAAKGQGMLVLTIQPDPEDTGIVRELGWRAGIPGAEITLSPGNADTATGPPLGAFQTDSTGTVRVPDLPDGSYFVEVHRLLTSAEVARLAPSDDVIGFMTQTVLKSAQGKGAVIVAAPSSRRRSIVISEWAFFGEAIPGVGGYDFGGYLELANNSDTTVYLDGLVIGRGAAWPEEAYPGECASWDWENNDPDGAWTLWFDSLPGTGHTYPLAPGAVSVIATDAIDHSAITPEGLDLSHANFDFVGTADAVNPSVPNTISLGTEPYPDGHGLILNGLATTVVFVALPVDTAAVPEKWDGFHMLKRIPRLRILDVMSIFWPGLTYPVCPHLVSSNFERRSAPLDISHVDGEGDAGRYSLHRKLAYTRADGRRILQHTRTTDADFFLGLRAPFQLP